eukprot:gene10613-biopygen8179
MTASYPLNAAITSNNPTLTGTATGYSVSPALPSGLTLDTTTGIISGTPTVAVAAANYIVTVTGSSSTTATATLSIATTGKCNMLGHLIENDQAPSPVTALSYTITSASYPINTVIVSNNPTPTGTAISYSVSPTLPTGLTVDTSTGIISGTPTVVTAAVGYVVKVTGPNSSSATATLSITTTGKCNMLGHLIGNDQGMTVTDTTPVTYPMGYAITPNTPTLGGSPTSFTISPTLPVGLEISATTGVISRTPTVEIVNTIYTVTGTDGTNTGTGTVSIATGKCNMPVPKRLTVTYTTPVKYPLGSWSTPNTPTIGGFPTSFTISPTLPAGLAISAVTGVIPGYPTTETVTTIYTVTATDGTNTGTGTVTIATGKCNMLGHIFGNDLMSAYKPPNA